MVDDNTSNPQSESEPLPTPGPAVSSLDDLARAGDPALTEDLALSLLKHGDLPVEVLEQLARNSSALKSRKVKLALASYLHTPRHISIPLVRQFYTFNLRRVALTPTVPADVKVIAENVLISRLKTVTLGERLTLARRASGRIAGALLLDSETQVMQTALENGRLTEPLVVQSVLSPQAKLPFIRALAMHAKWSFRREVRIALLRTEFLAPGLALEFSRGISLPMLREILSNSRLPEAVREHVLKESETSSSP